MRHMPLKPLQKFAIHGSGNVIRSETAMHRLQVSIQQWPRGWPSTSWVPAAEGTAVSYDARHCALCGCRQVRRRQPECRLKLTRQSGYWRTFYLRDRMHRSVLRVLKCSVDVTSRLIVSVAISLRLCTGSRRNVRFGVRKDRRQKT